MLSLQVSMPGHAAILSRHYVRAQHLALHCLFRNALEPFSPSTNGESNEEGDKFDGSQGVEDSRAQRKRLWRLPRLPPIRIEVRRFISNSEFPDISQVPHTSQINSCSAFTVRTKVKPVESPSASASTLVLVKQVSKYFSNSKASKQVLED